MVDGTPEVLELLVPCNSRKCKDLDSRLLAAFVTVLQATSTLHDILGKMEDKDFEPEQVMT
eukprot:8018607-Karenia_brevis.AAC.1